MWTLAREAVVGFEGSFFVVVVDVFDCSGYCRFFVEVWRYVIFLPGNQLTTGFGTRRIDGGFGKCFYIVSVATDFRGYGAVGLPLPSRRFGGGFGEIWCCGVFGCSVYCEIGCAFGAYVEFVGELNKLSLAFVGGGESVVGFESFQVSENWVGIWR